MSINFMYLVFLVYNIYNKFILIMQLKLMI